MSEDLETTANFDNILTVIRPFGRYQILHVILTGICAIPVGASNFANILLAAIPNHWCINGETNGTLSNSSGIKFTSENLLDNLTVEGAQDVDDVCSYTTYGYNNSENSLPCTKWEYDTSVYKSTAASEWDLVCSSEWIASLSQTTYMLGFLFGALIFGAVSDRFGRKTSIMISIFLMIATGTTAAFMPNFWSFMAVRIVAGGAAAGEFSSGFVIVMEIIGKDQRMTTGIFYQAWFATGYMLLALTGYFLRDFRHIELVIGLAPVLVVPSFWFMDESPRWLLTEGKLSRASMVIKRAARLNKAAYPEFMLTKETQLLSEKESSEDKPAPATIIDLFRTPNLRMKSLIVCYIWYVCSVVYYGLSFGTRDLVGGPYLNLFLSGLMEFPSFLLAVLVLDRVGRKWPMSLSLILGGVCCLGMAAVPKGYEIIATVFSMSGKFFISGGFAIIYVYSAELFPTVVRNIGVGAGTMCAMIAGLVAPPIALMAKFWAPLPYFVFGAFTLLGGVLTLLLPETLHQCLPETLEDGENFGKYNDNRFCHLPCVNQPKNKSNMQKRDHLQTESL